MSPQKVLLIVLFWAITTNYCFAISVTNMYCKRYINKIKFIYDK